MKLHDLLTKLIDRRPKVTVVLMIPPDIINKGWSNVSITTDNVEFHFTHGIVREEYFFKGDLKVNTIVENVIMPCEKT